MSSLAMAAQWPPWSSAPILIAISGGLAWEQRGIHGKWQRDTGRRRHHHRYGLRSFWNQRGYYAEGMRWIDAVLVSNDALSTAARVRGMNDKASLAFFRGDNIRAETIAREAIPLAYQLKDDELILGAENFVGMLSADYAESVRLLKHGTEIAKQAGWAKAYTVAASALAKRTYIHGDLDEATVLLNEHLVLVRGQDNDIGVAGTLGSLGKIAFRRGQHAQAHALLEDSIAAAHRGGLKTFAANAMILLATLNVRTTEPRPTLESLDVMRNSKKLLRFWR